jgi:hypothetical protein
MSDFFQTGVYGGSGSNDLTVADHTNALGPGTSTNFDTGDLRRKYNFGDRVSELAIAQDPFFRFLSKVAKKPVDDPEFKWAEKRPSFHKRYAYVGAVWDGSAFDDDSDMAAAKAAGDVIKVRMIGDYKNQGNIQNVYGNTANDWAIGASGTMPKFFLPGQIVKIPTAASAGGAVTDYLLVRVNTVTEYTGAGSYNDATTTSSNNPDMVELNTTCVKAGSSGNSRYLSATASIDDASTVTPASQRIHDQLEPMRCYVVGSAYTEGSGYPETWKDQPYSTNIGLTQIWKTSMAMTNTARATSLKYDSNEWARIWKEKLVEHKWDLETSLLFGSQYTDTSNDIKYTQGAVDYITQYGNQFSLSTATKTADDFLDDMSNYVDPRYNQSTATVFFCNTAVYNWLHKLGGYFKNNLEISSNFRSDLAMTGKKKVFGVDISTFSTPYGDINVSRNIHLDGTNVKMMGINMKNCAWRPLVGNGINRDTSVYVGVQTLENSGVDRRVDLILTEGGMEWQLPESHALWT